MRVASMVQFIAMLVPVAAQTQTATTPETSAAPAQRASPCDSGAYREFDFWAGNWVVRVATGEEAGRNSIDIENVNFLPKPFSVIELAEAARRAAGSK